MYISYNERVRSFSLPAFSQDANTRILVVGNSIGRDLANMLLETDRLSEKSLVYRDIGPFEGFSKRFLLENTALLASANVVMLAVEGGGNAEDVMQEIRALSESTDARLIVFGPKNFGYNLNPYGRISMADRPDVLAPVPPEIVELNDALAAKLPDEEYVDLLRLLGPAGADIHVFDEGGFMLTPDRVHLTKFGAVFLANQLTKARPDIVALLD